MAEIAKPNFHAGAEIIRAQAAKIDEQAQALTLAQARIRELETALEPFANDWRAFPGCDPDGEPTKVTVADFKRARQAIKEAGE